jgi:hypothetical protein
MAAFLIKFINPTIKTMADARDDIPQTIASRPVAPLDPMLGDRDLPIAS